MCGEKSMPSRTSSKTTGSPPRMRGKVADTLCAMSLMGITPACAGKVKPVLWAARVAGITPACAGKSKSLPSPHTGSKDHPRVCGEKGGQFEEVVFDEGSPPRMRGKACDTDTVGEAAGITPAYAGKRCSARTPTFRTWDHPRVCGEKPVFPSGAASTVGSPLRMRGKD